jgi:5-methylcytosine-specific restriction enzyme subunit McrC
MATWSLSSTRAEISEYGEEWAEPELVDAVPAETWKQLSLDPALRPGDNGLYRLKAAQYVGVSRIPVGSSYIPLQIAPKFPSADIFFLSDYAYGKHRDLLLDSRLRAGTDVLLRDPAACLISWFLNEIESFARRRLRRSYVTGRDVFVGDYRGRELIEDYIESHLGIGHPERMPAEFFDLSVDTPANRLLRGSARHAALLAEQLTVPEAREAVLRQARRTIAAYNGVTDVRVTERDFVRLPGPLPRHYRPILEQTRAFVSGVHLNREIGLVTQDAFLWDMNILFQEALRGMLSAAPGIELDPERPGASVKNAVGGKVGSSTKVDPDYVAKIDGTKLLLDAKYKRTGAVGQAGGIDEGTEPDEEAKEIAVASTRIKISRSDIYQIVAYATHHKLTPAVPGLVYPVILSNGEHLPPPLLIDDFGPLVHLVFVDIGPSAKANLDEFLDTLRGVARSPALAPARAA